MHNLIAVLGAQTILNQCYDLPSLNNPILSADLPAQCGLHLRQSGADFGGRQLRRAESGRYRFRAELPAHLRQRSSPRLPRHPDLRHPPRQLCQPDRSDLRRPAAQRAWRSADYRQRRCHLRLRSVRYALFAQLYRPPDDRRLRELFLGPGPAAGEPGLDDRALLSGRALPQTSASTIGSTSGSNSTAASTISSTPRPRSACSAPAAATRTIRSAATSTQAPRSTSRALSFPTLGPPSGGPFFFAGPSHGRSCRSPRRSR